MKEQENYIGKDIVEPTWFVMANLPMAVMYDLPMAVMYGPGKVE